MKRLFQRTAKAGGPDIGAHLLTFSAFSQVPKDVDPIAKTYMEVVIEESFESIMKKDVAEKAGVHEAADEPAGKTLRSE
jgi:uncharacterized protein (UPF0262 family)